MMKYKMVQSSTLSAVAYRDGHGKVALGISSAYPMKHWDLHLKYPSDRYKMLNEDDNPWNRLTTFLTSRNV